MTITNKKLYTASIRRLRMKRSWWSQNSCFIGVECRDSKKFKLRLKSLNLKIINRTEAPILDKKKEQNGNKSPSWLGSNSNPFDWKSWDQPLAATARKGNTYIRDSSETTSLRFQNADGDIPPEMIKIKRRGEKNSLGTVGLNKAGPVNNQVLWARSTRWGEPALPCRSAGIPAPQGKKTRLIGSNYVFNYCIIAARQYLLIRVRLIVRYCVISWSNVE